MCLNIHTVIQVKLINSPTLSCDLNSLVYAVLQRPPSISMQTTQEYKIRTKSFSKSFNLKIILPKKIDKVSYC